MYAALHIEYQHIQNLGFLPRGRNQIVYICLKKLRNLYHNIFLRGAFQQRT